MNLFLKPAPRIPHVLGPQLLWPVMATAACLAIVLVVVAAERATGHQISLCLFKQLTHIPCPTCGSTRLVLSLAQGDVTHAFLLNPLVFVLLAAMTAVVLLRVTLGLRLNIVISARARLATWILSACLFAANWVYLLLQGR